MNTITKATILTKLETIYQAAVRSNKWPTALRVAHLQGAYIGLFEKRHFPDVKRISEMSEKELHDFVAVLKKHDPELEKMEQQQQKEMGYPEKPPLIPKHPPPCVCPECLSYE